VPFVYDQTYGKLVAEIFEVPLIDTSIIIVKLSDIEGFYFQGSLDDSSLFDPSKVSSDKSWFFDSGLQIANSTLKGKQTIVLYYDTLSSLIDPKSSDYNFYAEGDAYSHQLIDYISGKSDQAPAVVPYTNYINTFPMILFPDSQVPKK
jgi:hypothetical protein